MLAGRPAPLGRQAGLSQGSQTNESTCRSSYLPVSPIPCLTELVHGCLPACLLAYLPRSQPTSQPTRHVQPTSQSTPVGQTSDMLTRLGGGPALPQASSQPSAIAALSPGEGRLSARPCLSQAFGTRLAGRARGEAWQGTTRVWLGWALQGRAGQLGQGGLGHARQGEAEQEGRPGQRATEGRAGMQTGLPCR